MVWYPGLGVLWWFEWTVSQWLTAWCGIRAYGSLFCLLWPWVHVFHDKLLGVWFDSIESWFLFGRLWLLMPRPKWVDLGSLVWLFGAYFWRPIGLGSSLCDSWCEPRLKWVEGLGFGLVNQPEIWPCWYFISCYVFVDLTCYCCGTLVPAEYFVESRSFLVSTRDLLLYW